MEQGFADLPLDGRVIRGIEIAVGEQARLTRVQQVVLQSLLSKNQARWPDLLLKAHTGTGKTLAFLVPALERLLNVTLPTANQGGLRMLVVAPTRELVLQLARVTHTLLQGVGPALRSSFVSGGFSLKEDVERLQVDTPHILIGTPGRIVQHLQGTPNFVRALSSVETLVLDEADRLLDPTFIHQVDYIVRCLPVSPKPQTIMCSATFSAPVRQFAFRSLRADFETLDLTTTGKQDEGSVSHETGEVAGKVQQVLVRYRPDCFVEALLGTLAAELKSQEGGCRRVLLLFPTVRWLQFFYVLLKHHAGLPHLWAVHSRLPDDRRRARIALFSRGAPPVHGVLFATDLAARGLDFDVDAVIQVGPPVDREQYVHRAGRTGRLAARGRSILLVGALEEAAVLEDLQGLDIQEELAPSLEAFPNEADAIPISAATMAALAGWWDNPPVSTSGDCFFSGIITFYLHRRKHFRITTDTIVRFAADMLRSAAYPVEEQGLPFVPTGLERRVKQEDPLSVLQSAPASVRNHRARALTPQNRNKAVEEDCRGSTQNV